MAYFLDPDLAALMLAPSQVTSTPNPKSGQSRRPNKFGKQCHGCGTWVPAQQGYLGKEGGAWVVYCIKCP